MTESALNRSSGRRTLTYRPDVDGLRTVAVVIVALNHASVSFLGGGFVGVDVFFVISGFLITGLLLAEGGDERRISIAGFYARRVRRILPAAAVVILATIGFTYALAGGPAGNDVALDGIWAMLFLANVHFAASGTDYFDRGASTSPLEHYWSLGVEEQFYLVWPLALLVIGLLVVGRARRTAVLATVCVAVVASLAYSVWITGASPTDAYFSPFARAFELGLGALLAVVLPRLPALGVTASTAVAALGLLMIGAAAVLLDGDSGVPGYVVLLPTVGAVLVIAGGAWHRTPVGQVLGSAPMVYVGKRSYGFYLWHFPFLMVPALWLSRPLAVNEQVALVIAAFAAACVSYAVLEEPIRHSAWLRDRPAGVTLAIGAAILAGVVAVALLLRTVNAPPPERADPDYSFTDGGARGDGGGDDEGGPTLPTSADVEAAVAEAVGLTAAPADVTPPVAAVAEQGSLDADEAACDRDYEATTIDDVCFLGDPEGERTVAIWGDSHASMWVPALDAVATEQGMRLAVFAKYGCGPVLDIEPWHPTEDRAYEECPPFRDAAVAAIEDLQPDVLVVTGSWRGWAYSDGGTRVAGGEFDADNGWTPDPAVDQVWQDGLTRALDAVTPAAGATFLLGDSAYPLVDPAQCLPTNEDDVQACDFPTAEGVYADHNAAEQRTAEAAGVTYVPTTPWLCTDEVCPVVVGDHVVYRDGYHLTRQYSLWLARALGDSLDLL